VKDEPRYQGRGHPLQRKKQRSGCGVRAGKAAINSSGPAPACRDCARKPGISFSRSATRGMWSQTQTEACRRMAMPKPAPQQSKPASGDQATSTLAAGVDAQTRRRRSARQWRGGSCRNAIGRPILHKQGFTGMGEG
jgi:hypothetical protein